MYLNVKPPCLIKNNVHITDPVQIAELMAHHYETVSGNGSYPAAFQRIREQMEHHLCFDTSEVLPYNSPITYLELQRLLSSCGSSASGEDNISYAMIRKSHPTCLLLLLAIFNKVFSTGTYPSQWLSSLVLSFPKPGKSPTLEENLRPISLTSCVGKLLEKILNTRLAMVLESSGVLPVHQFGFRRMHSTHDALNRFISDVAGALNAKQEVVCVSFDMRKAYDTTWRFGILQTLFDVGLRGSLAYTIQSYLANRTFRTKIGTALSSVHSFDQGVPQGGVLSCTLFSLAINGILQSVPEDVKAALYVDDLLIYCCGKFVPGLERRVQLSVNKVSAWASARGFVFSASKTNCIHFHRRRHFQPPLLLTLNGSIIPNRDSIKYLGMVVDCKLNWKEHIKAVRTDCLRRLDLLKCISRTSWGSDRTTMLRVYRAIIRSKLDYGCFLYGTASRSSLQLLDSIHNAAIRLCTGAYRSSPVASIYADSGEMSLSLRRDQLLLQYYARTLQLPSSAMFPYVQPPQHPPMESIPKIATRIATLESNLNLNIACLPFNYQTAPLWQCPPNALCKDYSFPKKDSCSALALRSYFADHMS